MAQVISDDSLEDANPWTLQCSRLCYLADSAHPPLEVRASASSLAIKRCKTVQLDARQPLMLLECFILRSGRRNTAAVVSGDIGGFEYRWLS